MIWKLISLKPGALARYPRNQKYPAFIYVEQRLKYHQPVRGSAPYVEEITEGQEILMPSFRLTNREAAIELLIETAAQSGFTEDRIEVVEFVHSNGERSMCLIPMDVQVLSAPLRFFDSESGAMI